MSDAGQSPQNDASHNMAATMVGKFPFTPPPRPAANPPPQAPASGPMPAPAQTARPSSVAPVSASKQRSSAVLLLVIGFVAVLLLGALLLFLFLYNFRS
jgi:hypothetical protein